MVVKVLAFSVYDDDDYVRRAYDHGGAGYLLKSETPATPLTVLTRIFHGERDLFSHAIAEKLRSWGYDFENQLVYA